MTVAHETQTPSVGPELLRPDQVAKMLDVSVNTLAIWRHYRRGPSYVKFGRQVRYPLDVVTRFLELSMRSCDPEISRRRPR